MATVAMHREDTSTSSEDEASTAETVSTTTTTTADMCRAEVRNGEKVLRCTGCGYTSDRRANVTRHYERIHGKLKKHRKCACGEVFQTKWEFYNHCEEYHPTLRQSSYTTTQVYKLKETKTRLKLKTNKRSYVRVESQPARKRYLTRASTRRLRTQQEPSTSSTESVASFSSGSNTSLHKETSCSGHESEDTNDENQEVSSTSNIEAIVAGSSGGSDCTQEKKESFCIYQAEDNNCENTVASFAPLPIKKRYLQNDRKVFGDITNRRVEVLRVNNCSDNNNNNTEVPVRDLYLSTIDKQLRSFISHIDFNELDAILILRNMKESM